MHKAKTKVPGQLLCLSHSKLISRLSLWSSIKILRLPFLLLLTVYFLFWMVFSIVVMVSLMAALYLPPTSLDMLFTKLTSFLTFLLGCAVLRSQAMFKTEPSFYPQQSSFQRLASLHFLLHSPHLESLLWSAFQMYPEPTCFLPQVIDTTLIILATIIASLKCYNRLL